MAEDETIPYSQRLINVSEGKLDSDDFVSFLKHPRFIPALMESLPPRVPKPITAHTVQPSACGMASQAVVHARAMMQSAEHLLF